MSIKWILLKNETRLLQVKARMLQTFTQINSIMHMRTQALETIHKFKVPDIINIERKGGFFGLKT